MGFNLGFKGLKCDFMNLMTKAELLNLCYSVCKFCLRLDVRESVHRSIIHTENPTGCNSIKIFISYLHEAQHVSGDTPPIIRSLKLH